MAIASDRGHEGASYTGIAAGGLDQRHPRSRNSLALGPFDESDTDSVFDAPERVPHSSLALPTWVIANRLFGAGVGANLRLPSLRERSFSCFPGPLWPLAVAES
jgi:hypothetical protein